LSDEWLLVFSRLDDRKPLLDQVGIVEVTAPEEPGGVPSPVSPMGFDAGASTQPATPAKKSARLT
jgi:hypothetical protein